MYSRSKMPSCVYPLDWFPKELYWTGSFDVSRGINKEQRDALRKDVNGDALDP